MTSPFGDIGSAPGREQKLQFAQSDLLPLARMLTVLLLSASFETWAISKIGGIQNMNLHAFSRLAISIVVVLLGFTTAAHAGPPLICHPIEIGNAQSLPWVEFNHTGSTDYDLKNLSRDTLAILDSNTPVLVHMETLRPATIYARQDPQVAKELITRVQTRATKIDAARPPGRPCVV
jgi:hypothetical protein